MKRLIPVVITIVLLVSCSTVNPYTDERPYVANIGSDGDYVFTTTRNIINLDNVKITRISGCYNPETSRIYGALEGSFSKVLFDGALNLSGAFKKTQQGSIKVYYDESNGLYYYCPASGIVLFASSDIEDVYENTFVKTTPSVDIVSAIKMVGSELGFYVRKPSSVPDVGFNIPEATVKHFDRICAAINGETLDVDFAMENEDYANTFFTLIKASIIGKTILSGEKPDLEALKENITCEGSTVSMREIDFPKEEQDKVISTIIKGN